MVMSFMIPCVFDLYGRLSICFAFISLGRISYMYSSLPRSRDDKCIFEEFDSGMVGRMSS